MGLRKLLIIGTFVSIFAISALAAPDDALEEPELPLLNHDAWSMVVDEDAGLVTHDLTGFECPFELPGGYTIQSTAQYKLGGQDVSCAYVREGRRAYITFYLSWYGRPAGSKEQAEGVIENFKSTKTLGDERANEPVTIALGETDTACHYIEHIEKTNTDDRNTAVRTCTLSGWVYKTRITWHDGETFTDADLAFQARQAPLAQTLSACADIALPTEEAIAGDTSNAVALALMASLTLDDLKFISGDGDEENTERVKTLIRPDTNIDIDTAQCILDVPSSDTKAYTLLAPAKSPIHKISYTRSDIYHREENPLLWVSGLSLGALVFEDTTYGAWTTDSEGTDHLIETYETLPTARQMQDLLNKLLSGEVKSIASYKKDAEGNSTLSITTDALDEDAPDEDTLGETPEE